MEEILLVNIITEQTTRALWEVKNIIDCVPDELWNKEYCEMPCWKHIYHMLHSLEFRHLHSHMGMIMGFIIDDTGLWPRVLGLENSFPIGEYKRYF